MQQIAHFFLCLLEELRVSSMKGYRAALKYVFAIATTDWAPNRVISRMLSSIERFLERLGHQNGTLLWFLGA